MTRGMQNLPVRGRAATQGRSHEARRNIVGAATKVIADQGLARLTHRSVAQDAGVSLAATTYYYKSKFDIVADVSNTILDSYVDLLTRAADRAGAVPKGARDFQDFMARLIRNSAGRHRSGNLAWMEILLDAVRQPQNMQLARQWSSMLDRLWANIAKAHGEHDPGATARSGIDLAIGLLLMVLALELDPDDVDAVLQDDADPFTRWARPDALPAQGKPSPHRATPKAQATRQRIIDETIGILLEEGPGAVSYRLIARRSGLTPAAPAYYFDTPAALLREAQIALFASSKERYRQTITGNVLSALDLDQLIDVTATIFMREVTEFGPQNIASYAIWLEASRSPALRGQVWTAIADQARAWQRVFQMLDAGAGPLDGLLAQALFIGKLIRILATGSNTADLAQVRREFARDLAALVNRTYWKSGTNKQKS